MPEYLHPGVYVEEVPSSIKPIAGVSTSTPAFVGVVPDSVDIPEENPDFDPDPSNADPNNKKFRTWKFPAPQADVDAAKKDRDALAQAGVKPPRPQDTTAPGLKKFRDAQEKLALAARRSAASDLAPEGVPILCTTFGEFKLHFGDFSTNEDQKRLVHGVYGFYNNGGTRCYVMRYKDITGLKAPTALAPLEPIDELSMVVAPGIVDEVVQGNIIDHCENLHDRVAILDAPPNPDQLIVDDIKVMSNTDYGALYFPRIKVFDIVTALTQVDGPDVADLDEGEIYVSPSGHMAGIYSRVDHTRGVHKAPANEPVHGALGLEHQISKALQDGLNPDGINCIRHINGQVTVWGARTIGGDINADLKYISTRRLLIFIEKSIDEGTQWVVFEPNDRSLWAKIERNVGAFLTTVWRDGALFGSTPQEAFYVRCDDETNPPEERDLGKVTTEIGVAIVKPAEFVVFRVQQWAGPAAQ
ncbi:MAG: phage tail sheath C-terminal domain-containing protein [Candidatus Sulfotelmatobacter sp.]